MLFLPLYPSKNGDAVIYKKSSLSSTSNREKRPAEKV
jgi:hypothetical protein